MSIKDIYELEQNREETSTIYLWKEGIFLKAYEKSAYLFHRFIRPYRIKSNFYKNIGQEVISLGFPSSGLDALVASCGLEVLSQSDKASRLTCCGLYYQPDDYTRFKQTIRSLPPIADNTVARTESESVCAKGESIIHRLRDFNLAGSTPMECMIFLNELKRCL